MNAQATLDNATREAARVAALCGGAIGTWSSPSGTQYSNGVQGSPCPQAIDQTVLQNTGFLKTTGTNPSISSVAPASGSPPYCAAGQTVYAYYAPSGCVIQVWSSSSVAASFPSSAGKSTERRSRPSPGSRMAAQRSTAWANAGSDS